METITNVASTAATTVSNLIYGQPAKDNETAGQEPVSGQQGKGTATEPFDQGNAEPATTSSTNNATTDGKSDEFLKLNPTMGTSATTDSSADTKTGTSGAPSMPILPLGPDAMNLGSEKTTPNSTEKTGVTDTVWKPTALDEVKPSGAPGAGPEAPSDVKPAAPEGYQSSSTKTEEPVAAKVEAAKDYVSAATTSDTKGEARPQTTSIHPDVDAILSGSAAKGEHSIPAEEAADPHSKMEGKTTRHTDKSQPDPVGEAKVVDSSAHKTESNKSESSKPEPASPTSGEEKDSKMSHLKEKLKTKLHIGSKDK